ncbi:MAG: response regulator transcription factor [Spartobacteria bacterium]|nr:response regulator transcription factor [Spartobacteria bacterium]
MARESILLVEDEHDIRELLKFHLERENLAVEACEKGEDALALLKTRGVSLVLLDLMLPGIDGLEVCRRLKAQPDTRDIPIIMLTAKDSEADIVTGLEMGAADYICKPFSPRVLMARIRAVLRRPATDVLNDTAGPAITIGALTIDPGRHKVEIKGKEIPLTFTEFRILRLLAESPGRAFSRAQIVDHVRGESYSVTERIVDVQMVSLRKKLGNLGDWIETVRGVGYRFRET